MDNHSKFDIFVAHTVAPIVLTIGALLGGFSLAAANGWVPAIPGSPLNPSPTQIESPSTPTPTPAPQPVAPRSTDDGTVNI